MKITIIQNSQPLIVNAENYENLPFLMGAKIMATCVSNTPVETMTTEPLAKTLARKHETLVQRHHSGYDFEYLTLVMEDVSKLFCMFLNNLHVYCTEETSGRHKVLVLPAKEQAVFDYFYNKIYNHQLEKNPDAINSKSAMHHIRQVALENARYTTGLDARTNICYGVSLRQLNYIYGWAEKFLAKDDYNTYEALVVDEMESFLKALDDLEINGTKIIDPILKKDPYGRSFNLFGNFERKPEYYGAVYEVYYNASATATAQMQRHRQLNYLINDPDKQQEYEYYIPKVVREIEGLDEEWVDKIESLNNIPQARLLEVRETGEVGGLVCKLKERACNFAQEEARQISSEVAYRVFTGMADYDASLSKELCDRYLNKNRCYFEDYERCPCKSPCKPDDAITFEMERE